MISGRKYLLLFIFLHEYIVSGIQVPTYPYSFSERENGHHKDERPTNGYRFMPQKYKKNVNRNPLVRPPVTHNSPSVLSDAIHIVDPPSFSQKVNTFYGYPLGLDNLKQKYTKSSIYQKRLPQESLLELPQNYFSHLDQKYKFPVKESKRQSPRSRVKNVPLEYDPAQVFLEENKTIQKTRKRRKPNGRKEHGHQFQSSKNAPDVVPTRHTPQFTQPKVKPTYLGIQTPSQVSLRSQLDDLKERHKSYFLDDLDEFPVVVREIKKTKNKQDESNEHSPISFGHDIYDGEKHHFEKELKSKNVRNKNFAVTEATTVKETTFVPYRLLASVRHTNKVTHKPRNHEDPRVKARVRTEQAFTVHSEQLYEDKEFDHGDEERHATPKKNEQRQRHNGDRGTKKFRNKRSSDKNPKEHIFLKKIQTVYSEQGYEDEQYDHGDELKHANYREKYRPRRQVGSENVSQLIEHVEELPVALSLVDPDGKKLTGNALIDYITQLLKNSTKYLPENTSRTTQETSSVILPPEQFEKILQTSTTESDFPKFSYNHLNIFTTPETSPLWYAEKTSNFNESPYDKEIISDCNEDYNFEQNSNKKKLGNLPSQIDCFKETLFGKDPFVNPLFKEDIASVYSLNVGARNPSSLVYKDVMETIKNSLKSEKQLKLVSTQSTPDRNVENNDRRSINLSQPTKKVPKSVYNEIYSFLPVFDITKYFPKVYMIKPSGKIYAIKFRPSSTADDPSNRTLTTEGTTRINGKDVSGQNIPTLKRSIVRKDTFLEPRSVYRFLPSDAIRRPQVTPKITERGL